YLGASPMFCAETGCATVRASAWSHPLGVPMPMLGIAYFGTMIALAFVARPRLRLALAIAGGAWALGLVALQAFVIHAWCKLCLVADPVAIVHAAAVVAGATTLRLSWRAALGVPVVAAVVLALGLFAHPPQPPAPTGTPAWV